jgi:hypothetical protein
MRFLILILFIGFSGIAHTQVIERFVVASAGETFEKSNFSIEWTLGEPIVKTIVGSTNTITQGFHQSIFVVSSIGDMIPPTFPAFKIYPNPASDYFYLDFNGVSQSVQYQLLDINGSIILSGVLSGNKERIELSNLANTSYIIKITDLKTNNTRSFNLQKAQ